MSVVPIPVRTRCMEKNDKGIVTATGESFDDLKDDQIKDVHVSA